LKKPKKPSATNQNIPTKIHLLEILNGILNISMNLKIKAAFHIECPGNKGYCGLQKCFSDLILNLQQSKISLHNKYYMRYPYLNGR
jgi:hypothetical protein